jgi:RNA polymerase sigma-70 factor, ECF subfamily
MSFRVRFGQYCVEATVDPIEEARLLEAARIGDEAAFVALVRPCRAELHAHCYRMLASPDDADDAVQEALLRAWKALPKFEARSTVRTWLFKIATNTALDIGTDRTRRELPVNLETADGPPTDVAWIGPFPTGAAHDPEARYAARETIELAYVAALQYLPSNQRAVLILRDVLGFRASEVAEMLDTTVPAANSLLQRARAAVADRAPRLSQFEELTNLGDANVVDLAARYARAIEGGADIDTLLSLLTEDATWAMPPHRVWFRGHEDISRFLTDDVFPQRWRHTTTTANGQLAVAGYMFESATETYVGTALDVLELRDGRIASVTGFLVSEEAGSLVLFGRFGLPERPEV